MDIQAGWVRHWEPMENSFLGEGLVFNPDGVKDAIVHLSEVQDQSQLLVLLEPDSSLTYYAGFGWTESGHVAGVSDWDEVLSKQAMIVQNPLLITLK